MTSKNVTIVGLGLIGGSMALELRDKGFATTLIGVDNNEDHVRQALALKLVDRVEPLEAAVRDADLVVLAVPVSTICVLLPQVLDAVSAKTVVTDVGSTKEKIVAAIKKHPKRKQYVPSHPMAGTENSGPQAAIFGLFADKTAVICEGPDCDRAKVKVVDSMYEALKMRRITMTSKEHDMHAAFVSHLSHISSFVLANTVLDIEKNASRIFDLAGGGFESTVRLAKSSPEMWLPIFEQNNSNVLKALGAYIKHLQKFQKTLKQKKYGETRKLLTKANEIRRVLKNITKTKD